MPEELTPAPAGFVPVHYLAEAVRIARWDDVAIRRIARDRKALLYGVLFFFLPFAHLSLNSAFPRIQTGSLSWTAFVFNSLLLFLLALVLTLAHYGATHLLALWLFGATGSYLGV
ncbi:MAG: hypothetical protein ACRESV_11390, partial [Nevskiales bacterium]